MVRRECLRAARVFVGPRYQHLHLREINIGLGV